MSAVIVTQMSLKDRWTIVRPCIVRLRSYEIALFDFLTMKWLRTPRSDIDEVTVEKYAPFPAYSIRVSKPGGEFAFVFLVKNGDRWKRLFEAMGVQVVRRDAR